MFHEKLSPRRLTWWLFVSALPLLSAFAAGTAWQTVLATGIVCGAIRILVEKYGKGQKHPLLNLLQVLWLGLLLGNLISGCMACWENERVQWVMPIVLLLLGAFSAQSGADRASRAAVVLSWLVFPVLVLVLGAGTAELRTDWMLPKPQSPSGWLLCVFLLPCITVFLPQREKTQSVLQAGGLCAIGTVLAFWVVSSISPQISNDAAEPLYLYCKAISFFGITERFEAALSCALTAGWFALSSILLSTAGQVLESSWTGRGKWGVWLCFGISGIVCLCKMYVNGYIMAIFTLIFWGLIPFLTQFVEGRKK